MSTTPFPSSHCAELHNAATLGPPRGRAAHAEPDSRLLYLLEAWTLTLAPPASPRPGARLPAPDAIADARCAQASPRHRSTPSTKGGVGGVLDRS